MASPLWLWQDGCGARIRVEAAVFEKVISGAGIRDLKYSRRPATGSGGQPVTTIG